MHMQSMDMPPQIKAITSGTVDIGFMLRMFSYPVGITAFGLPLQRFCLVVHQDAALGFWRNITAVLPPGIIWQIVQQQ